MSAFCRICNLAGHEHDTYVACNNCGSFACSKHHLWWPRSKNAFCTECFVGQAAQATSAAAGSLEAIASSKTETGRATAETIAGIIRERLRDATIEDLIGVLLAITQELERRDRERQG